MLGTTVGKYRITGTLGQGATGVVYKAVDESLGRDVALKILTPSLADAERCRRFQSEAAVLASLNHPGIAAIYDLFTSSTELVMVMELVRGETLEQLCDRVGPLPVDRAVYVIDQILSALEYAHDAGVVHRDLKPANIMLTEMGVKIMDFGVAHARRHPPAAESHIVGTPAYMAPEQALGESADEAADMYSVGVMLYRLLTGTLPFVAATPMEILQKQIAELPPPAWHHRSHLPAWCDTILSRALAKPVSDRFRSARAFRDALGGAVGYSARRNGAFGKLLQTPPRSVATARAFKRSAVPPGRRQARIHASLAAFAVLIGALASAPLLATPKRTTPAVTTPAPLVFDGTVVVPGGEERAAQVTLSDCNLTITTATETNQRLHLVPYGSVTSIGYAKARQPLWSSANGFAPVPRALRPRNRSTPRHWLVVRTNMEARFIVLQFDAPQIASLLPAIEDRSGRAPKVFRRSGTR